jgi:transposase
MIKSRRTYDKEFKQEAVRLVVEEGRKAVEVERNLGIGIGTVGRWVREYKEDPAYAFPGKGRLKAPDEEMHRLKVELKRVKQERDILKKALAYFAEDQK